ncbi:MAG: hypothetical protein ACE5D8_06770 [Fidelibacterota bacterium]
MNQTFDPSALASFLRSALDRAVQCRADSEIHPVIVINALKNILGDDRENVPKDLKSWVESYLSGFFKYRDWKTNPDPSEQFARGAVFTMDLEDAILKGQREEAERCAGDLYWAAEHKGSVLEIMTETGLHEPATHALFFYHLLRASVFYQPPESLWQFILAGLDRLSHKQLPPTTSGAEVTPDDLLPGAFHAMSLEDLIAFAAVYRLWQFESVRQANIRRKLSVWLQEHRSDIYSGTTIPTAKFYTDLHRYKRQGGHFFIHLISAGEDHLFPQRIVLLDAIRFLVRVTPEDYINVLAHRLEEGIET